MSTENIIEKVKVKISDKDQTTAANKRDELLFEDKWIKVLKKDGWYTYTSAGKDGVVVLVFDEDKGQVVGRYEETIPHRDGVKLTSLTGMCDKEGKSTAQIAIEELKEEAGMTFKVDQLIPLGYYYPSKSADTKIWAFGVNGAGQNTGEALGDGTKGEEGAYSEWISVSDAIKSESAAIGFCLSRLALKGINLYKNV